MSNEKEVEATKTMFSNHKQTCDPVIKESDTKKTSIQNTQNAPKGKCPIHVSYNDGKLQCVDLKEPYLSQGKHVMQELTGTLDGDIAGEILLRGVSAMPQPNQLERNFNTILQTLSDCAPKDSTEAKLCMQSTALFAQGMRHIEKAEYSDRIDHSEFYMKNAIKLLRLHNETIEALARYRRGGEQRVVVQHVQVNEGGQAVVGNIVNGGGGKC